MVTFFVVKDYSWGKRFVITQGEVFLDKLRKHDIKNGGISASKTGCNLPGSMGL